MKKLFIVGVIGIGIILGGCSNTTQDKNKTIESSNTQEENETIEYLNAGDIFTVTDDRGTYEFKVNEAKYLGAHEGDELKQKRLQITWEINNISFKGEILDENNNVIENDIVMIEQDVLKVKDDEGYVLSTMSEGWEGDWVNDYKNVKIGEKMIKKHTWILNKEDSEYVTVGFERMKNQEFKININR